MRTPPRPPPNPSSPAARAQGGGPPPAAARGERSPAARAQGGGPPPAAARGERSPAARARREALLAAAEELIAAHGLDALTVDDVVGRAGVAKGTFYIYFATKAALLAALQARYAAEMRDRQQEALDALPPGAHARRLDRWVAVAIGGHLERAPLHDALFHHDVSALAITTGLDADNPQLALLERLLADGARDGAFRLDDTAVAAALLYGAMHAAVDLLLAAADPPGSRRIVAATQRFARGAVGLG